MKKIKTPELDKMLEITDKSRVIGGFIEWLRGERGIELAVLGEDEYGDEALLPFHTTTEKLLAEYFDIDLNKVEEERRALLASCR